MEPKTPLSTEGTVGYAVSLSPNRLIGGLVLAAFLLLLVHSLLTVYHYRVEEVSRIPWRQLFDVDEENNLPTWFSGFLLTVTSAAV